MATTEMYYPTGSYDPGAPASRSPIIKRISWGSIFAGVVVAMIVQLLLGLLGLAFGAGSIDPYGESPSVSGLSIGAGIWLVVSSLIALFLGGWTAGWLSGLPRGTGTMLHGVVTWGLATFLLFFVLTTAIGALVGGAFNLVGSGLNLVGKGAAATVAGAATGVDVNSAKNNLMAFLNLDTPADDNAGGAMDETGARRRGNVSEELDRQTSRPALERDTAYVGVISRAIANDKPSLDQADRQNLVNVLMTNQNMSREDAEAQVDRLNQKYVEGRQKFAEAKTKAGETVKQATDVAARGVSTAATWTFIMVTLGGIAAAIGGYVSRPKRDSVDEPLDRPMRNTTTRERNL